MFKILRHPLAPLYTAADYLKAMGEALAILFVVVWTVTYISRPTYHGENITDVNPLKDRIGYNNLCVGFDTAPAVYFAQFCWPYVSYLGVRFAWVDVQRCTLLKQHKEMSVCRFTVTILLDFLYVASVAGFGLVFVISPIASDDRPFNGVWTHSIFFMQYIVMRFAVVYMQFSNYRGPGEPASSGVSTLSWAFLCVYGVVSVAYTALLVVNYLHYDRECLPRGLKPEYRCEEKPEYLLANGTVNTSLTCPTLLTGPRGTCKPLPLVPPWLTMLLDYGWFACLPLTSKFMPPNESLQLQYSWRRIEGQARVDARESKMREKAALPLQDQREIAKGSIKPSRLVAWITSCLAGGDQTGDYFADALNVKAEYAGAFFSQRDGEDPSRPPATCPFAGNSATVHLGHKEVRQILETRGAKLEDGSAERRNDLGLLRLNSCLFARTGKIMLGNTPEDHRVCRDFFGEGSSKIQPKPDLAQRLKNQVLAKNRLDISMKGTLAIWANRELWSSLLDLQLDERQGQEWVEYQAQVVELVGKPEKVAKLSKGLKESREKWRSMIEKALQGKGAADGVLPVLVDACMDTLLFAGGLSVPMVLISIVGLRVNGVVPRHLVLEDMKDARCFALEAARCFPAVFSVTQWTGNRQTIVALATAMTDPRVFGAHGRDYFDHKNKRGFDFDNEGMSFAEKAGPKYCCPGRAFALECIAAFAMAFNPNEWRVEGAGRNDQTLLTKHAPPYYFDAYLVRRDDQDEQDDENASLLPYPPPSPGASVPLQPCMVPTAADMRAAMSQATAGDEATHHATAAAPHVHQGTPPRARPPRLNPL